MRDLFRRLRIWWKAKWGDRYNVALHDLERFKGLPYEDRIVDRRGGEDYVRQQIEEYHKTPPILLLDVPVVRNKNGVVIRAGRSVRETINESLDELKALRYDNHGERAHD